MHIVIWILEGIVFSVFIAPLLYMWIRFGQHSVDKLGLCMLVSFCIATIAYFILLLVSGEAWLQNRDVSMLLWTAVSNLGLLVLSIVVLWMVFRSSK